MTAPYDDAWAKRSSPALQRIEPISNNLPPAG